MKKAYQFLATGFEEVEALCPLDILRRGGVEVVNVSITGQLLVEGAHGVFVQADTLFEEADFGDADLLMLPGGMPGATNLNSHDPLRQLLLGHHARGGLVAAICAAPLVLGGLGLLEGRRATCYPGFQQTLLGADYTADLFVVDGNVITGEGPAAAFPYGYALLSMLVDEPTAFGVAEGMRYNHLMQSR